MASHPSPNPTKPLTKAQKDLLMQIHDKGSFLVSSNGYRVTKVLFQAGYLKEGKTYFHFDPTEKNPRKRMTSHTVYRLNTAGRQLVKRLLG